MPASIGDAKLHTKICDPRAMNRGQMTSGSQTHTPDTSAIANRLVADMINAFEDWVEECSEVRDRYSRWSAASSDDAGCAFAAYNSALDREESAAMRYQEIARRLGDTAFELKPITGRKPSP